MKKSTRKQPATLKAPLQYIGGTPRVFIVSDSVGRLWQIDPERGTYKEVKAA